MGFNVGSRDPRGISMRWRQLGGVWYLEWSENRGTGIIRRKAHDTEVLLIEHIIKLKKELSAAPELRTAASLNLKRITTLKRINVK